MTDLPKFHETFIPILEVLSDGQILQYKELKNIVKDKYYSDLSDDLLQKTTKVTGTNVLMDRIGWGKSYLKQAKLLDYPSRAHVQITDKGKQYLKEGKISLQQLKHDPDWTKYQEEKERIKKTSGILLGIHQAGFAQEEKERIKKTSGILLGIHQAGFAQEEKERIKKTSGGGDIYEEVTSEEQVQIIIEEIEAKVKKELLDRIKEVDPYYFEKIILRLLNKMGYGDTIETTKSNDGGIDGIINEDKLGLEKIYIQAKRYTENKVREKEIRNFIGAMSGDTTKGVFVTTSEFDEKAVKKAQEAHHSIVLIDGYKLVNLMHDYGVGVQVKETIELKELDEDFFVEE